MRLLQLRANQESFRTVTFNPNGISIIRAKQVNSGEKDTYNSVGKSLLVCLVHFCLGSRNNPELEKKLPGWEFSLDFQIRDEVYTAVRSTGSQEKIYLDDREYPLKDFNQYLENKLFHNMPGDIGYISFRSLISRFIRPRKSSYVTYDTFIKEEEKGGGYPQMLNNAYLLGLDIERAAQKYQLKEEWDKYRNLKKNIEKDPVMQRFFMGNGGSESIDIEIVYLEDKIAKFKKNIDSFRVAEDYDQLRKEADEISAALQINKNKATVLKNAVRNIEKSLEIKPDISSQKIIGLYREAETDLGDLVKKRLEEVEVFNKKLLDNRKTRLFQEKIKIEQELKNIETEISTLGKEEDEKLRLLGATGSLEEYAKLNEQLAVLQVKLDKIKQYRHLLNEYEIKIEEVTKSFSNENLETNKYLEENEDTRKSNILLFKSFAQRFYENKKAGIEIKNNPGKNQLRYDIHASIDSDSGDGVGYVKMFCFDWTLLTAQHNHEVKFLFHDSRLLAEVDPRQVTVMFKTAFEHSIKNGFQYIISANQKDLESLKDKLQPGEYREIIENNVVLDLTDEADSSKLLGIQVDLDYEKE